MNPPHTIGTSNPHIYNKCTYIHYTQADTPNCTCIYPHHTHTYEPTHLNINVYKYTYLHQYTQNHYGRKTPFSIHFMDKPEHCDTGHQPCWTIYINTEVKCLCSGDQSLPACDGRKHGRPFFWKFDATNI